MEKVFGINREEFIELNEEQTVFVDRKNELTKAGCGARTINESKTYMFDQYLACVYKEITRGMSKKKIEMLDDAVSGIYNRAAFCGYLVGLKSEESYDDRIKAEADEFIEYNKKRRG